MRRSIIIIIWGILLLIKQGTIIGAEEGVHFFLDDSNPNLLKIIPKYGLGQEQRSIGLEVIIDDGPIPEGKAIIVNPLDFAEENITPAIKQLINNYRLWFIKEQTSKKYGKKRAKRSFLSKDKKLLFITAPDPKKNDSERELEQTYLDVLDIASEFSTFDSIVFPTIITDPLARDEDRTVIASESKKRESIIILEAIMKFIKKNLGEGLSLKKIYLKPGKHDKEVHLLAYRETLKHLLSQPDPEQAGRYTDFIKRMKRRIGWKGILGIVTFSALAAYLYYSSR